MSTGRNPVSSGTGSRQTGSPGRAPRRAAVVLAVLASLSAAGENPWQKIFYGTTEVHLIDLEVVVADADGRPVPDLSQQDFQLFEDGQPVEISYFEEIGGRAEPLATLPAETAEDAADAANPSSEVPRELSAPSDRRLQIVLFVDSANLAAANRKRVVGQLEEFLVDAWRDDTSLTLVTSNRGLEILGPWQPDRHRVLAQAMLEKTLDGAAGASRLDFELRELIRDLQAINVEAGSGLFEVKRAGDDAFGGLPGDRNDDRGANDTSDQQARRQAQDDIARQANSLLPRIEALAMQRMERVEATLRDLDQVIAVTASLPGRKVLLYVSDGLPLDPAAALKDAYAERVAPLRGGGASLSVDLDIGRDELSREFHDLLTRASSGGVAFYTLFAAPPASLTAGSAATAAGAGGNFGSWDDSLASGEERIFQEGIILMAEETGGRYALSSSAIATALAGIYADFDNRYVLGYLPGGEDPDRERALEVRLPGRDDLELRYRRSFRDKTPAQQAAERTYAALFTGGLENPLNAGLEARGQIPAEEGNFEVPITVSLPIDRLVLVPGTGNHQAQVSLFVAVLDERGRRSEVRRHLCPIRIPNDQLLTALGHSATCGVRLLMRSGPQRVAVSVLDELSSRHSTVTLAVDVGGLGEPEL